MRPRPDVVLRLRVRNHPGVMSHVCGLFARRAFNVEGILCLPVGDASESAILLLVDDDARLEQMVRQLRKLEDVLAIERADAAGAAFEAAGRYFGSMTRSGSTVSAASAALGGEDTTR